MPALGYEFYGLFRTLLNLGVKRSSMYEGNFCIMGSIRNFIKLNMKWPRKRE